MTRFGLFGLPRPGSSGITINVTTNRTSGVGPLEVFFDASATVSNRTPTANSQSEAFHMLFFEWDFDDPTATYANFPEVDANLEHGAIARHVFANAGTYNVRLTVRDMIGNVETYNIVITVTTVESAVGYQGVWVSGGGSDSNDGLSVGNPKLTWDAAVGVVEAQSGPTKLHVDRGYTYGTDDPGISALNGACVIEPYGSGDDPIIQANSNTDKGFTINDVDDLRICNLDFRGTGADATQAGIEFISPHTGTDVLIWRCSVRDFEHGIQTTGNIDRSQTSIVDCNLQDCLGYGFRFNYGEHVAFVANIMTDVSSGPTGQAEHPIRCSLTHSVIRWNKILGGASAKNMIKFRGWDSINDTRPTTTNEYCI